MLQLLNFSYTILSWALYAYMIIMAVYCLMTWLPNSLNSKFGDIMRRLVEPFLGLFDRFIPTIAGLDFSPIIAFAILAVVRRGLDMLYWALAGNLVA